MQKERYSNVGSEMRKRTWRMRENCAKLKKMQGKREKKEDRKEKCEVTGYRDNKLTYREIGRKHLNLTNDATTVLEDWGVESCEWMPREAVIRKKVVGGKETYPKPGEGGNLKKCNGERYGWVAKKYVGKIIRKKIRRVWKRLN